MGDWDTLLWRQPQWRLSFLNGTGFTMMLVGLRVVSVRKWKILEKVWPFSNMNTKQLPANLKLSPQFFLIPTFQDLGKQKYICHSRERRHGGVKVSPALEITESFVCSQGGMKTWPEAKTCQEKGLHLKLQPLELSVGPFYNLLFSFGYFYTTNVHQIFNLAFWSCPKRYPFVLADK